MKKRMLEKGEIAFTIVLGLFSLVCLIASLRLFIDAPTLNGEGTAPLIASTVLLLTTLLTLIKARELVPAFDKNSALGNRVRELLLFLFPDKTGLVMIYCLAYAILLQFLGFIISTFLFLVGSMLTLNHEKKLQVFLISIITLACIWVLFQFIFKVQLP